MSSARRYRIMPMPEVTVAVINDRVYVATRWGTDPPMSLTPEDADKLSAALDAAALEARRLDDSQYSKGPLS